MNSQTLNQYDSSLSSCWYYKFKLFYRHVWAFNLHIYIV